MIIRQGLLLKSETGVRIIIPEGLENRKLLRLRQKARNKNEIHARTWARKLLAMKQIRNQDIDLKLLFRLEKVTVMA